jgi:2-dehydro-3-deoxygluconokinase
MEHYNPLLSNISSHKFITIGEIMLRLTPPNYQKIRMANEFEATYGGSEANIALSLANLGIDSTFFSVVPTIPSARAPSVCSAATMSTAPR